MKTMILLLLLAMPFGSEFQINSRTSLSQANPILLTDPNGNFIVVWSSYFNTTGRSNEIIARKFDTNGIPVSDEFQLNTIVSGNQTFPAIACDSADNYIAVWQGPGQPEQNTTNIYAVNFDSSLNINPEWQVNSICDGTLQNPNISMNEYTQTLVLWEYVNFPEQDDISICGRLYDSNGLSASEEFIINEQPGKCRYPAGAMDANGNFAVVWMEDKSINLIKARLYNSDGSARTSPFNISSTGFSSITKPSIAMDKAGFFLITWDGDPNRAADDDIHARLYEPNGNALCEQFTVNTETSGSQQNPRVAMNNSGEFIIVWDSKAEAVTIEKDIFGRKFNSIGLPEGNQFRINTFTENDQKYPDVSLNNSGVFVTIWQSNTQDSSSWGIFGSVGSFYESAENSPENTPLK